MNVHRNNNKCHWISCYWCYAIIIIVIIKNSECNWIHWSGKIYIFGFGSHYKYEDQWYKIGLHKLKWGGDLKLRFDNWKSSALTSELPIEYSLSINFFFINKWYFGSAATKY